MRQTFAIDGCVVPFAAGQSILEAAQAAGIYIPRLCFDSRVSASGNCRLCMVTVGGRTLPSCITPAADGQEVVSQSPELIDLRRALTRMLFVEGNHFCPSCEKSGNCKLQAVAYELEMLDFHYSQLWPTRDVDASHPDVWLDRDRCIMCGLCVRASRELDRKNVFELGGRGAATRLMVNSPSGLLADSDVQSTDQAVDVCPVGALLPQKGAFAVPIGWRRYDRRTISGRAIQKGGQWHAD